MVQRSKDVSVIDPPKATPREQVWEAPRIVSRKDWVFCSCDTFLQERQRATLPEGWAFAPDHGPACLRRAVRPALEPSPVRDGVAQD